MGPATDGVSPVVRRRRKDDRPIMFYDGDCRLCTVTARLVLAADTGRRLRTATLDSPDADRYLRRLSKQERYRAFHLYRDGRVWSGADAIAPLLELLPPLRAAGILIARSARARRITGSFYEAVSARRGTIGRLLPRVGPPSR